MNDQLALQTLLRTKLQEMKHKNPSISLRAFSKKVGIHYGALSSILNGKRNVSRDLAERIAVRLYLDPQERSELLSLFPLSKKKKTTSELKTNGTESGVVLNKRYLELSASQFKIVAEWEHFAVMSLLNCKNFKNDSKWIASRLGITITRAETILNRLIELELFKINEAGELTRSKKSYRTTDDLASISLKQCHEQSFELAKDSLYRDPVEKRDMTSVTMAIDPKKLSMAKELIRKFQDELSDLLETGNQTEVYRLSMQLFPLTKD